MQIAVHPDEVEHRRRERVYSLAVVELPLVRVIGSALLSLAIFVHNYTLLEGISRGSWLTATLILAGYCVVSWAVLYTGFRLEPPRDLTLLFLCLDLLVWTYAIYATGGERSWLFFILLMRVADQTQTTFRRCLGFATLATACYAAMLLAIAATEDRAILTSGYVKLSLILLSGIYISIAARTAERRRAQLTGALRMARELIQQLEEQSSELRDARSRAEEASAAKSEFLANMSHEMRTPLHAVIGMLQLAQDGEQSPQRVRQLEMARRSAESLLSTIDDLLDFSKIEARKLELEPVYFSLRELMTETMKPLGVTAAGKDLALAFFVDHDVPDALWGDPLRVRQILVNLVGNALKFTPAGEIAVCVSRLKAEAGQTTLRFEVRDTGIGIDPQKRQVIFLPFTQADSSHSRRYGGTGLGLAIVARLVEAMGGSIQVASEPGKGSEFVFELPFECDSIDAAAPRRSWESALAGMSILVIEPQATSRAYMLDTLRSRGIAACAAPSFADAPDGPWACVIVDDAHLDDAPHAVPVISIVSPMTALPNTRLSVSRPVAERELLDAIGAAVGVAEPPREFTLERPSIDDRPLRILIADDHPVNQEFAAEALRRMGHRVVVASDGEEALALMQRERFDLVLMDIQMPGLDGLEATRRYRQQERGRRTPIIALTAHTRREDRERCLAAGMDGMLTKPIDRDQLAETVRDFVGVAGIDPVVDAVGGNLQLLARVSDAFARQTPTLLASMNDAIANADAEALYQTAHKMKGSVSHFAGDRAFEVALSLEQAAKAADFERARAIAPEMSEALTELQRKIEMALV